MPINTPTDITFDRIKSFVSKMSFQKCLNEFKQEPSPDPSAWTNAQLPFYTPPEAPPFKAAKPKIQQKNMPTLGFLDIPFKPPKLKALAGKRFSKRKKVDSEKLFKELDKTKEKMPLHKRTILPKVLEEPNKVMEKKKVMPKIILLQPNIHVYA